MDNVFQTDNAVSSQCDLTVVYMRKPCNQVPPTNSIHIRAYLPVEAYHRMKKKNTLNELDNIERVKKMLSQKERKPH